MSSSAREISPTVDVDFDVQRTQFVAVLFGGIAGDSSSLHNSLGRGNCNTLEVVAVARGIPPSLQETHGLPPLNPWSPGSTGSSIPEVSQDQRSAPLRTLQLKE